MSGQKTRRIKEMVKTIQILVEFEMMSHVTTSCEWISEQKVRHETDVLEN